VVRSFELFGTNVAIVMEFHPDDAVSSPSLLRKVHGWATDNGMRANFLMANWFPMKPLASRYLFIPSRLLPKQQALYVRYPRRQAAQRPWRVQIGDWDGL
jgi:hypothetical protein